MNLSVDRFRAAIHSVLRERVPVKGPSGSPGSWKCIKSEAHGSSFRFAFQVPAGYSASNVQALNNEIRAACGSAITIDDRGGVVVIVVHDGKALPRRRFAFDDRGIYAGYNTRFSWELVAMIAGAGLLVIAIGSSAISRIWENAF